MNPLPINEADLHAYVDALLPPSRRAEVEAYLATHPEQAERVRVYREHAHAIRALFAPVLDEAAPARTIEATRAPAGSRVRRLLRWPSRRSTQGIAAAIALACASAGAGWAGHAALQRPVIGLQAASAPFPAEPTSSLPRQAAIAHVVYSPDVRRPVEIDADQEDQLVAWLSKRLDANIRPPKLGALGYELIGGRLLPGTNGPVAQFMYHDITGQRVTLYVATENTVNRDTGFRFAQEGPVNVFYWVDGKFGYALSAGVDKGELARVATAVHAQIARL